MRIHRCTHTHARTHARTRTHTHTNTHTYNNQLTDLKSNFPLTFNKPTTSAGAGAGCVLTACTDCGASTTLGAWGQNINTVSINYNTHIITRMWLCTHACTCIHIYICEQFLIIIFTTVHGTHWCNIWFQNCVVFIDWVNLFWKLDTL